VGEQVESLRVVMPASVALVFQPGAPEVTARLDRGQLGSVVQQLVAHARRALPDGGVIRVTTGLEPVDPPAADAPPTAAATAWATITIDDGGPGLNREARERLLDPFPGGVSDDDRALGLALARGMVRRHGGRLVVAGRLGQGTTLTVRLPAQAAASATSDPGSTSGQRLLVVDDDPDIRRYAERVLRAGGYDVVLCEDGVEALALVASDEAFDAVVLDWALPGLDGRRVKEQLQARHRRLPLLVISGHPRDQYEALGGVSADTPWLGKPFTPTALLQAVQSVLAQADEAHGS
jgi:CheY-like chemotaxis protein